MGGVYFNKKEYHKAIAFYENVMHLKPDYVDPYTNNAVSYLSLGRFDSGVYYLYKAIAIDPTYNRSYEYLALAYKSNGNSDSAKKYEAIAQKYNPGFRL